MRYLGILWCAFFCTAISAQNTTLNQLPPHPVNSFTEAFTEGRPALHLRGRIEYVDQEGLPPGQANTLNTRLSFSSGHYQGFAGMIEFSNTTSYFNQRQNTGLPGTSPSTRPIIPDPKGSSVNRSFLQYTGVDETLFNFGRQWITLDNQRFVGNETFRQTPQSFDAVSITNASFLNTELFYAYITEVNNFWNGNDRAVGQNKSRSHLLNATWTPLPFFVGTAFIYIDNNRAVPTTSNDTYGVRVSGEYRLNEIFSAYYAGDYARQYGQHNNPVHYKNSYYDVLGGVKLSFAEDWISDVDIQMSHEVFGSNGAVSFQTPLGSNYDFNGLAGQFVTKPVGGLKDFYVKGSTRILDYEAKLALHQFKAKAFNTRYGHEWDVSLDYHWNEQFILGVTYSNFEATPNGGYTDVGKFWLTATAAI